MLFRYFLILLFLNNIESIRNIFARSKSTKLKEQCGYSILLNNNYWLLKQTSQALKAIQNKQLTFNNLPWNRIKNSIQQIYYACSIDNNIQNSKELMYIYQTALKASSFLAQQAKYNLSHPALIKII